MPDYQRTSEADIQHRATEARRLMEEPLLVAAFAQLTEATLAELLATRGAEPEDDRKRRALVERLNVIEEVKTDLALAIAHGKAVADKGQRRG